MTTTQTQTALCGATTLGLFDDPLGPCVREQDHAHLFHRDERGTEWRRRGEHYFTALPVDPEMERAATERAIKMAEESEKSTAWFKAHSSPPPEVALLQAALREALDCITYGLGQADPADCARWRALIEETA